MPYERHALTEKILKDAWDKAVDGTLLTIDPASQEQEIPGDFLAQVLQGEKMEKAPQRVMIAGAHITGGFDVKSSKLLCPLELTDCVFDKSPNLDQANARNITLKGCTFPGLRGWELKVEHDFSLEDSSSSNLVDLCGAQIGGQVDLKGVTLSAPGPEVLKLNGLVVQREMRWSGMTTHGQVTMIGARVSKQFICIGTTLVNAGGIALLAQGIKVGSSAYMKSGFSASGEVDISGAEITGRLDCRNGTFRSAGLEQGALRADGIHIENDLICENGFLAEGGVNLLGATIGGSLRCTGGRFINPGSLAIRAARAKISQDFECKRGFRAEGQVLLAGCKIGGSAKFQGGQFIHPTDSALDGTGMEVGQNVVLGKDYPGEQMPAEGFISEGEVKLVDAKIMQDLNCTGGRFSNSQRVALNAQGVTVRDVLLENDFCADGMLDLSGSQIGGKLLCSGGQFTGSRVSLRADGMTVQREAQLDDGFRAEGKVHIRRAQFGAGLSFDGAFLAAVGGSNSLTLRGSSIKGRLNLVTREKPPGAMDLRRVVVTELYDDKAVWPDRIKLHGLVYETLREDGPKIKDRLEWLKSNGKYEPQIYRQLAKVYQVTGDEDLARKVLIAEQDERRKSRPGFHGVLAWWGGWFLKATVGYGYNPFRVLMELAVLEVIGGIVFSILRNDIHPVSPHVVGDYQPWLYSLDLLLPVVNFRWSLWFYPTGAAVWWAAAFTATGWALATALVVGLGGVFKRK
ncbi:hypothetical protein JCM4814A_15590 [Streptomyces phaeofaciens JCM 4814]|uniref:Membrane-associated oxidoreductase n=2 Tax=Streptomyces phaeofaciens TaxID=68254 RepID=A0A918H9P9_9ACTN|nr:hypothetical protein GCM10010226_26370 [Streptomyces phaeofaciens]